MKWQEPLVLRWISPRSEHMLWWLQFIIYIVHLNFAKRRDFKHSHSKKKKLMLTMWDESERWLVVSDSLWPHGLYSPGNSPGQNIGVGSLSLLQGIFTTQRSNPGLPHCRQILYQLYHQGSPRILEWVANPFSRGSYQLRNWIGVPCIAGRFFMSWANRKDHVRWWMCSFTWLL